MSHGPTVSPIILIFRPPDAVFEEETQPNAHRSPNEGGCTVVLERLHQKCILVVLD